MDINTDSPDRKIEFINKINALIQEYQMNLVPTVTLIPTNHGTYELKGNLEVVPISK